MGYAISWIAVRGKSADAVLDALDLARTGEFEDIPESPLVAAALPDGWTLVQAEGFDAPLVAARRLAPLSAGATVLALGVEDHVMASELTAYVDGVEAWHVAHDAQLAPDHLLARGDLPEAYAGIAARLRAEQAEADAEGGGVDLIHDIPIALGHALCGYRHDVMPEADGEGAPPFETLVDRGGAHAAGARPWWKFW